MKRFFRILLRIGAGIVTLAFLITAVVLICFVHWDQSLYPDGSQMLDIDGSTATFYSADGAAAYQGEWQDSCAHDSGVSYVTSRLRAGSKEYSGQWQQGLYHGEGQLYHTNGNVMYSGQWENGLRHGEGREYSPDGVLRYAGQWQDGLRHGQGDQYREGKLIYSGQWREGQRHGQGKEYYPDGSLLCAGTWRDGRYLRLDKVCLPDGTELEPTPAYMYIWGLDRGLKPEGALRAWQQASVLEPHITPVTGDPREQAILYSMLEFSTLYDWQEPPEGLASSLAAILRLPPSVTEGMVREHIRKRFLLGPIEDEPDLLPQLDDEPQERLGVAVKDLRLAVTRLDCPGPERVTIHEIGHLVDFILTDWTEELIILLRDYREDEGKGIFTSYYYDCQREYFAEFFSQYFLSDHHVDIISRPLLANRAPQTFDFFQEMFGLSPVELASPRQLTVEFSPTGREIEGKTELEVSTAADISALYARSYHSSSAELTDQGWEIKMFLELLTRPSHLVEAGDNFLHQGGYVLYIALDEDGNYTIGSSELIAASRPHPEPLQAEICPPLVRIKAGFVNLFRTLKGLWD